MDTRLNPAQAEVRERFAALFDDELTPSIRRMGEQPRTAEAEVEVEQLRQLVWQALVDLGATRLLVPVERGGDAGGAAGGQQSAVVLAELLGGALYQGPLLDTMTASEILATDDALVARIVDGTPVALAGRQHGSDEPSNLPPMTLAADRLSAHRRFVSHAAQAEYLCVLGSQYDQPACALVARTDPAVVLRRQQDSGRGEWYEVRLHEASVLAAPADFAQRWPALLAGARLRQAGYLVGMCQAGLELAVHRVRDRRQFDQPIGRFQAPAFALAEAAARIDGARLLVLAAAWQADQGADIRLPAAQALAMAADLSRTVLSKAIHLHGAFGMTEQADSQLFYRRAAIERGWLGSPRALRAEVVPLLLAQRRADRLPASGVSDAAGIAG